MTRKEYLSKLANELHYDEERLLVVVELLNANPDMSENDFDAAWAGSRARHRCAVVSSDSIVLHPGQASLRQTPGVAGSSIQRRHF
jgi:hypothetical protein